MESLGDRERDFWIAHERIRVKGELPCPIVRGTEAYGAEGGQTPSPTKFTRYNPTVFKRCEVDLLV